MSLISIFEDVHVKHLLHCSSKENEKHHSFNNNLKTPASLIADEALETALISPDITT